jgi:hypothetical protein
MKAINRSPKPTTIILKKNNERSKERQQSVKTVLHVKNVQGLTKVESHNENDDGLDSEIHHMQIVESKIDLPQMQKVNISR